MSVAFYKRVHGRFRNKLCKAFVCDCIHYVNVPHNYISSEIWKFLKIVKTMLTRSMVTVNSTGASTVFRTDRIPGDFTIV